MEAAHYAALSSELCSQRKTITAAACGSMDHGEGRRSLGEVCIGAKRKDYTKRTFVGCVSVRLTPPPHLLSSLSSRFNIIEL